MKYRKMKALSPNMIAMLVHIKRRNSRGVAVYKLDKRTLKALYARYLVYSARSDYIQLSETGVAVSKLARFYT